MDNPLRVYENIGEAIGCTPLIKLRNILKENSITCQMWAKCEFFNPGSSFRDRISRAVISQKVKTTPKSKEVSFKRKLPLTDAVGLSIAGIAKDVHLKLMISPEATKEKMELIEALGANMMMDFTLESDVLDDKVDESEVDTYDRIESCKVVESELEKFCTEIYQQMSYQASYGLDYVFMLDSEAVVEGVAKNFRKIDPAVNVIGIRIKDFHQSAHLEDKLFSKPENSDTTESESNQASKNSEYAKAWVEISENEALVEARELLKSEGLIVGKLGGAAFAASSKFLKLNNIYGEHDLKCVIVLTGSAQESFSNELSQSTMIGKNIYPIENFGTSENDYFGGKSIKDFIDCFSYIPYLDNRLTISDCLDLFNQNISVLPIRKGDQILGILTKTSLIKSAITNPLYCLSSCIKFVKNDFLKLSSEAPMALLQNCLEKHEDVIVLDTNNGKTDLYSASLDDLFSIIQEKLKQIL